MNILTLTACLLMVFGIFKVLDITISDFILDIFKLFERKETSLNNKIKFASKKKKEFWLVALIRETKEILKYTNKEEKFSKLCIMSTFSMLIGIYIAIYIKNYFLTPVLAIVFLTIPFQYIKFTAMAYKRELSKELEVTLSIITTSYIRCENIIDAVEENIESIKPPLKNVFSEFLVETQYISSDISKALLNLREKIDDVIFQEWIDNLIACQEDINLKRTLNVTLSKLTKLNILIKESNTNQYEPLKEFLVLVFIVYANIPFLRLMNKNFYNTLMFTNKGKITLLIIVTLTFISLLGVMRLIKPIEPNSIEEIS